MFVHHVYFWLNNSGSKDDLNKLAQGLKSMESIKDIKIFHVGKPANTNRDVIDSSYALSLLLCFENKDQQDNYQVDPIHLKFIENCKNLWRKVVVYDSVDFT